MFAPNSKLKKILGTYGNCAYIHRDGVVIWEKKTVKVKGGNNTTIDVWHIVPCEISIRVRDYGKQHYSDASQVDRLVVHDASLIADGFDYVEVNFNSCSDSSKERNLIINTVKFAKGEHKWRDVEIVGVWGGKVTIQPNPYTMYGSGRTDSSIRAYLDYSWRSGNSVITYGTIPEQKVEALQLTVSN